MKKYRACYIIVILFLISSLWGCGGGGAGAPGSSGSDETGVILEAYVRPYYFTANWTISNTETVSTITFEGNFTNSVDVTQNPDCNPQTPDINESEYFSDHNAVLVVNARLLNPSSPFKPGTLYITEYKIDYFRSTDSLTAPPIESDRRFVNILINPPPGSGNWYSAASVVFVDLIRKYEYVRLIDSGMYSARPGYRNNYSAEYTFLGKDSYGKSFSFKVRHDFVMGSYDNCGLRN